MVETFSLAAFLFALLAYVEAKKNGKDSKKYFKELEEQLKNRE